jgi:hypothetical protein
MMKPAEASPKTRRAQQPAASVTHRTLFSKTPAATNNAMPLATLQQL